ncbi:MAG TPA: sigma-70 family RNA polymerase sigma factor [Nannocystis exedens]|nr:sigma-70 family RNA polymerase sigma factor [Nannocystis exedens]
MPASLDPKPRADEELVTALRSGELAAFDLLYQRYHRRLYGYIRRILRDPCVAEDLFQDVFLTVLRDRTYRPTEGRFSPWLFRVARNRCLAEVRKQQTRRGLAEEVRLRWQPPPSPSPERVVGDSTRVHAAMKALPEAQRQLILLKQLGELTYREIAALLGVAEGTIKSRLHTATVAFRRLLSEGSPEI